MAKNTTAHQGQSDSRARLPILIATLLLLASMAFIGSGIAGSALAQAGTDAIPSVTLDSNQPGQLVITWQAPEQTPSDYRIRWANTDLNWLSWSDDDEAERANEDPLAGVTTLTLYGLMPGDTYKVQMRSRYYNADRTVHESSGPWTNVVTQRVKNHPPAAPTGLTTSQVTHDSLTLTWTDPNNANITGYRILRGTDANSLTAIEPDTGSDNTTYTDSALEPETTYHYAVMALSQDGDGARPTTGVTTPAEPQSDETSQEQTEDDSTPAAPTGLTASQVTHESLTLTWDNPQDETITGYQVLRGTEADNLATINSDTGSNATQYQDDTVAAGTTYHYAVNAMNANGAGPQSSTLSVTTAASEPQKPTQQPPQRVVPRQAPPVTTLISNTGQGADDDAGGTTDRAQAFTTGSNPGGYTLSSVDIISEYAEGDDATVSVCPVDTNVHPTGTCTALTAPGGFAAGTLTFTAFPVMTLTRSTTYTVLVGTPGDETLQLDSTTSDGEDSGGAAGWSLADSYDFKNASNVWGTITNGQSFRITIKGTIVTSTNNSPTVANVIPNQTATTGTSFSYTFPANTFDDADTGDTLTYTATQADGVTALPTWLTFDAASRTFSGTPQTADAGKVSVKVTANDGAGGSASDEFDITVVTSVPVGWSLKPDGVAAGTQFRLLFLSSTSRNASSTVIADYNTFVQGHAAAGHTDIRAYSAGFRVVGCTADADARDNTATTYTSTAKGVPIYWLNGTKVVDEYEDFYDGDWDDEANNKNGSGTDGTDASQSANYPWTGCYHDGTEAFSGSTSRAIGAARVRLASPNSSESNAGPISNPSVAFDRDSTRPMYGLSAVFQVMTATSAAGTPAITAPNEFRVPAVLGIDLSGITDDDGVKSSRSNVARVDLPEEIDETEPTPGPAPRDGAQAEACPDPAPTPTVVDVTAVPIVVESTTDDYFVLYVRHGVDGTEVEIPVLVKRGAVGTTTLAENVEALPAERYRVEKYLIADPADVDGDCIDDITEFDDFGSMNPANPAGSIDFNDGAVAIPDRATFDTFRFDSGANSHLLFVLLGLNTGNPRIYYMNSNTHQSHNYFLEGV